MTGLPSWVELEYTQTLSWLEDQSRRIRMAYFYDDRGRLISDVDGKPYDGDYVRYNHEQATRQTMEEQHEPLLHGQSIDDITMEELEAEYAWANTHCAGAYARQLAHAMEYKLQQEKFRNQREQLIQEAARQKKDKEEAVKIMNRERVGDAERNRYSDHLATLYGQGFVDQEEFERLNDLALSAKTRGDLAPLLTDLPPLPAVVPDFAPVTAAIPQQSRLHGRVVRVAQHITGRGLFIGVSLVAVLGVVAFALTLVAAVL